MKNKKVVVTGGAGFLGSHVVEKLVESDNRVVVVDNLSNGKLYHLNKVIDSPNLQRIEADITRKENLKSAFYKCDIVIHLAVLGLRQSIKEPQLVNDVIVNGTMNCLDAAIKNDIKLFLNCSSSEVYGTAFYVPMDENHPLCPETPYAAAKVAQDMYVSSYGRTYGLTWTTIRPFNMYGPNSHWQGFRGELIPKMIVRAMNKKPLIIFGDGKQTRDFVYVGDAAEAIMAMVENDSCINKEINFCSGAETTIRMIAELICDYFGLPTEDYIRYEDARPGDVRRHLGSNEKFRHLVGFAPSVDINNGIIKTCDWFRALPFAPEELLSQEVLRNWE